MHQPSSHLVVVDTAGRELVAGNRLAVVVDTAGRELVAGNRLVVVDTAGRELVAGNRLAVVVDTAGREEELIGKRRFAVFQVVVGNPS